MTAPRPYLMGVLIALDRLGNALTGGPDDQTWSQTLGFDQLAGRQDTDRWRRIVDWLNLKITGEEHHCVRSLYRDDGRPIWPDRMPHGSPVANPYP